MPPLALACAAAAHTYQPNAPLHAATHERQCHVAIPRHTRYMSVLPAAVVLLLMSWRRWHVVQPTPHMLHTCAPCCLPCRSHPAVHERRSGGQQRFLLQRRLPHALHDEQYRRGINKDVVSCGAFAGIKGRRRSSRIPRMRCNMSNIDACIPFPTLPPLPAGCPGASATWCWAMPCGRCYCTTARTPCCACCTCALVRWDCSSPRVRFYERSSCNHVMRCL